MSSRKTLWLVLPVIILAFISLKINIVTANQSQNTFEINDQYINDDFYISLDGDWYFFHEQLLSVDDVHREIKKEKIDKVPVPSSFKEYTGEINTYGTYAIEVEIPVEYIGQNLAIHVPYQYSAYELYVDHNLIAKTGTVGHSELTHDSEMAPRTGEFVVQSDSFMLIMQISSFEHIRGGFENSIFLGESSQVSKKFTTNIIFSLFLNGSIFVVGIFLVLIGIHNRKEFAFLIFGLFSITISLWSIFTAPFYYTLMFTDVSWLWGTRLEYILTEAAAIYFVILFWYWHKETFSKVVMYVISFIFLAMIIVTLQTEPVFFQSLYFKVFLITIPFLMYSVYVVIQSIRKDNQYVKVNIIGATLIFLGFFNDYSLGQGWHSGSMLMLPAVSLFILIHVMSMSKNYAESFKDIERQNERLMELNNANIDLSNKLQKEIDSKDDFLMRTSYELRNPLHGIINLSHSILDQRSYLLDEKTRKDLELQISIGRHMSRSLEDLLDITRLREQKITLQKEMVFLRSISKGIVDMFSVLIENKNVEILVKIPKNFPPLYVDKNRLIQILFNLIHNAVKFTNEGSIVIDADIFKGQARIFIQDTGVGISKNELKKIFDAYKQVESEPLVRGEGLGLGLNISKQLVELHGGEIGVSSVIGKGTVFTFTLPLYEKHQTIMKGLADLPQKPAEPYYSKLPTTIEQAMTKAFTRKESRRSKPRILAIDDDVVNLKILKNILSEDQYEVEVVTNYNDLLEKIEESQWDLVISDVMMPNMSGYELTRIIRERYTMAELPIILMTARNNIEDVYTAFLAGANDYVSKPIDAIELNVRVQTLTNLQASINERMRMEAAWLQAQIRPHFLLNTLNSIISLSEIDIDLMNELIEHFINYLQSSFYYKNLDKTVPLEDELSLLESYLFIEGIRFGDRLKVIWDVDKNIKGNIPPLSIQTIVENAINHGVLKRIDGGTVTIQIRRDDKFFEVSVIDDGVGIDKEKLKNIFSIQPGKGVGIGLVNTEHRLKRLFGRGLNITSTLGVGTVVSFKVPLILG